MIKHMHYEKNLT